MNAPAIILILAALSASPRAAVTTHVDAKAPSIVEVQKKAVEHARLDPSEISSWKKRARRSALLPKLQVDYSRRMQWDVNVDVNDSVYVGTGGVTVGPEENTYAANQNSDNNVGVKAVWDFSGAVFNLDSLAVSEEARLLSRERQAILSEINRNYYERERLAGEIKFLTEELKKSDEPEKIKREIFAKKITMDEAGAALDALTGGWFSEQLRRGER